MTSVRIALAATAVLAAAANAATLAPFESGDWEITTKAHFDFAPGTPPIVARIGAYHTDDSRSRSSDQRRGSRRLTAIANAFFGPTRTSNRFARVTAV